MEFNNTQSEEKKEIKKPLRPCCACPETRNLRDECLREKGEDECKDFIERHNDCLKSLGFIIN